MSASGTRAERERTLLVVSASGEAVPVVAALRSLGCRVVACDGSPEAPALHAADAGILAAVDDPDAVVEAARAYGLRARLAGVLAVGVEVPCTVAAVADALGLPGPGLATAAVLGDRLRLRQRLRDAGVPVPWSAAVPDPDALCRLAGRRDGDVVVRATERHVAGVVRLGAGADPAWAFARAALSSPAGRVMVEDFVPGPELVAEVAVVDGRPTLVALGDRVRIEAGPFLVAESVSWPSGVHRALEERVAALAGAAAAVAGIARGLVRATVVVAPQGPILLALATALPGGFAATHGIPRATGTDVLEVAVRLACGDEAPLLPPRPAAGRGACCRALFAGAGVVTAVRGAAAAAAVDGVLGVDVRVVPGADVRPPTARRHAVAEVVAIGATAADARARAANAAACVRVETRSAGSGAAWGVARNAEY